MAETGGRNWFFVGQRYSWSYGAHWAARRGVAEACGSVVGETYQILETTDFTRVIDTIERSGAHLILSSLVGHDEVFFERQCSQHGLRATTRTFALVLDEATQQLIGNSRADGVWAAFGYFQGFGDNTDLETRYRASAKGILPPLSSLSETTYEAILAYARAATIASPDDRASIRRQLLAHTESDTATLAAKHRPILMAESRGGRLHPRTS